jgi:hypothetical protein
MGQLITSASEFEAIIDRAIVKLDKFLYERHSDPVVANCRRTLDKLKNLARDSDKLKAQRDALSKVCDTISEKLSDDSDLQSDLWDLLDFIDYRC